MINIIKRRYWKNMMDQKCVKKDEDSDVNAKTRVVNYGNKEFLIRIDETNALEEEQEQVISRDTNLW